MESQKRNKNQPILPTSVKPNVSARVSSVPALAIVPVRVKAKGGSAFVETFAFLDSGSNTSFSTKTLLRLLDVTGTTTNLSFTTIQGENVLVQCSLVAWRASKFCWKLCNGVIVS